MDARDIIYSRLCKIMGECKASSILNKCICDISNAQRLTNQAFKLGVGFGSLWFGAYYIGLAFSVLPSSLLFNGGKIYSRQKSIVMADAESILYNRHVELYNSHGESTISDELQTMLDTFFNMVPYLYGSNATLFFDIDGVSNMIGKCD